MFSLLLILFSVIDDYNITSSGASQAVLIFPAGSRNGEIVNVSITIRDDFFVEVTETIVLYASTQPELSASFAPGQNRITASILDDDGKQAGEVPSNFGIVTQYIAPVCNARIPSSKFNWTTAKQCDYWLKVGGDDNGISRPQNSLEDHQPEVL